MVLGWGCFHLLQHFKKIAAERGKVLKLYLFLHRPNTRNQLDVQVLTQWHRSSKQNKETNRYNTGFKGKARCELSAGLSSGREARMRLEAGRALDMEGIDERRPMRGGPWRRWKGMGRWCAPLR
jgi:hypothetical protein